MASEEVDWDTLLEAGIQYQQDYYELLPDWTLYEKNDYKYLMQNIGYALYGPPTESNNSADASACTTVCVVENNVRPNSDVTETLRYSDKSKKIIAKLHETIIEYGKGYSNEDDICYGLIFNVLLPYKPDKVKDEGEGKDEWDKRKCDKKSVQEKMKAKEREEEESRKAEEKKRASETEEKEKKKDDDKGEDGVKKQEEKEDKNGQMYLVPLFKVRKRIKQESNTVPKKCPDLYETWYIDVNCRVYKTWESYKADNTLHKCIMLLPKEGFYQPDPRHPITESESVVWLELVESPACSIAHTVVATADGVATLAGVAGIAIGVASFLTPIGPMALVAGAVATGVNGVWTVGRSAQHLIDRHTHEESISPLNLTAFGAWLGIVGAGVGLAASGSAALLSRAAQNGRKIGTAAQLAHNTLVIGNMGVSGIGIGLQAYNMYENYSETGTVNSMDILIFAGHVLFFSNAVINIKFAGDLIRTTQGQVMEEYQSSLRSKRLRKQYNKARRVAASNHPDPVSQNAEVIAYINSKKAMMKLNMNPNANPDVNLNANTNTNVNANPETHSSSDIPSGVVTMLVKGMRLMDPTSFLDSPTIATGHGFEEDDHVSENTMRCLRALLLDLLSNLFDTEDIPFRNVPTVPEFEPLLRDLQRMQDPLELLRKLFTLTIQLAQRSNHLGDFIAALMFFVWKYLKENLRRFSVDATNSLRGSAAYRYVVRILDAILEGLDIVVERLLSAASLYIERYGPFAIQM